MGRGDLIVLLLLAVINVHADVYLHNPPGSNNRLNGQNRNRQNNNRLFDSQNNNRGGYNVGGTGRDEGAATLTYIGGSILNIQWTNQHECGGKNTGCDLILQYTCDDSLRDGTSTRTPEENRDDPRKGRHESQQYYADCKNRKRDANLYHADQKLKKNDARSTRQNPKGKRSGLECPEERDYYPYHAPTPWRDIAIMTNNVNKCGQYKAQSQNVIGKGYCKGAGGRNGLQPITQTECQNNGGTWNLAPKHSIPAPACMPAPKSRDNHNGLAESTGENSADGIPKKLSYEWSVPNVDAEACSLRIRYNISVGDYEPFGVDKSNDNPRNNQGTPKLDIGSEYGLNANEAKQRGYVMENNPEIKPMRNFPGLDFQLAINTAQTGRTFEDRTHKFKITKKANIKSIPASAPVHNLNVIGKRGNIVQVYPAVEYGFEPAILKVQRGHYIHPQWTGSLRNPRNNDGEGRRGEDKSNIIAMTPRQYKQSAARANTHGHPANSYPASILGDTFLGVSKDMAQKLAFPKEGGNIQLAAGEQATFTEIGCFRDSRNRAISGGLTRYPRATVVQKCANKAKRAGNAVFAVEFNVECFTSASAEQTYARYGATTGCRNGRGGRWRMNVFRVAGANTGAAAAAGGTTAGNPNPVARIAYQTNPRYNCWRGCGRRGGPCTRRCGNGGECCRRGWGGCAAELSAAAPRRYHTCMALTAGRKDEPALDEVNVEETTPVEIPKENNEENAAEDDWNFEETVSDVVNDMDVSDEQITDILEEFDDEVLGEREKRRGGDAAKLDNAPAYVNVGPIQANTCGTYSYLCTRNNNFSNRSQKGKVVVCAT